MGGFPEFREERDGGAGRPPERASALLAALSASAANGAEILVREEEQVHASQVMRLGCDCPTRLVQPRCCRDCFLKSGALAENPPSATAQQLRAWGRG